MSEKSMLEISKVYVASQSLRKRLFNYLMSEQKLTPHRHENSKKDSSSVVKKVSYLRDILIVWSIRDNKASFSIFT